MTEILIQLSILFVSGLILWPWEILQPLHKLEYSVVVLNELRNILIVMIFTVIVTYVYSTLGNSLVILSSIQVVSGWMCILPLWLRVVVAILLKEYTIYVIHWLEHNNRFLWQTHKWHHSTEQMWWIPALKTSFIGLLTKQSAYLWFTLLAIPLKIVLFLGPIALANAFFVHANLQSKPWMKLVEIVFVTPRFHVIHHIENPEVHGKNLGTMFTFFDRLFGTYVDPDTIDHSQKQFGLDGEPVTVKMIVGI